MALRLMRKLKRLFSSKKSVAPASMESPSAFYARELGNALREQSFGIHDFEITEDSLLQCSASVTLLEGNTIQVTLKNSGYSIEDGQQIEEATQQTFESIESLLASASPLFEQKRQEALIQALERLEPTSKNSPNSR
ncbi:hypothetical protein AX14_013986 [Amanita brunnescens Koide BX004]|nr:hypothetical protein AX14_013986 [Amanita brunnescens Koide BX004]